MNLADLPGPAVDALYLACSAAVLGALCFRFRGKRRGAEAEPASREAVGGGRWEAGEIGAVLAAMVLLSPLSRKAHFVALFPAGAAGAAAIRESCPGRRGRPLALWIAAFRRRPDLVAVAGALLGLLSLDRDGVIGGTALLLAALLLEVRSRSGLDRGWTRILLGVLLVFGGIEALTGALRAEVFYSVLATVGAGVALVRASPVSRGYIWRDER